MRTSRIEATTSGFDAVRAAVKDIELYNRTLQKTVDLHEKLNASNASVVQSTSGLSKAQADVLINLTKANNAILQQIDLNTKASASVRSASASAVKANAEETQSVEQKAARQMFHHRTFLQERREQEAATRKYIQVMNDERREVEKLADAQRRQQQATSRAVGGYGPASGPLNLTTAGTKAEAQRTVNEMNSMFSEGARQGKRSLAEYTRGIQDTDQATRSVTTSTHNWLVAMLAYRVASTVFHEVVKGATEAKDALFDLEKQSARVQRVLGAENRPQIRAGIVAGSVNYGATAQQSGETLLQAGYFQRNPTIALKEMDTALKLVIGTEGDARDTTRLLATMMNLFGNQIKDTTDEAEKFRRMGELIAIVWKESHAEIGDITQTIKLLGPTAAAAGVPVEQLATIVGLLTAEGQRGSREGAGLVNVINKIVLGAADAEGAMKGLYVQTKEGGLDLYRTLINVQQSYEIVRQQRGQLAAEAYIHSMFPDIRGSSQVKSFIVAVESLSQDIGKRLMENTAKGIKGGTDEASKTVKLGMDNIGDQMSRAWSSTLKSMALEWAKFAESIGLVKWLENYNKQFEQGIKAEQRDLSVDKGIAVESPFAKTARTTHLLRTMAKQGDDVALRTMVLGGVGSFLDPDTGIMGMSAGERALVKPYMEKALRDWESRGDTDMSHAPNAIRASLIRSASGMDVSGPYLPGVAVGSKILGMKAKDTPEALAAARADAMRAAKERQDALDKKQAEADKKALEALELRIGATDREIEALKNRVESGTVADAPFHRRLAELGKERNREEQERLRLQKNTAEYAQRSRLGLLPGDDLSRYGVQVDERAKQALERKANEALAERIRVEERKKQDATTLLDAMVENRPPYNQLSASDRQKMIENQRASVDAFAVKALALKGESTLGYRYGVEGEVAKGRREAAKDWETGWKDWVKNLQDAAKERTRLADEARNEDIQRIKETADESIFQSQMGLRPNQMFPGESASAMEMRRYMGSRGMVAGETAARRKELADITAKKIPGATTVEDLAKNLAIDKQIAAVNRELQQLAKTAQDVEDTHFGDKVNLFWQQLDHTASMEAARADIVLGAPVAPGVGNQYRRGLQRLYSERGRAQSALDSASGINVRGIRKTDQEIEVLQVALDRIDADIRNAPVIQYNAIKSQVQQQVSSGAVAMWRGSLSPGQFVRGLGDTITEKAISAGAEKLFDPVVNVVTSQIYSIETNTKALDTLTGSITGSSSGKGITALPAGAAAAGGLIGVIAGAAGAAGTMGGLLPSPVGSSRTYSGSPANRPLSKRNTSEIAGAGLAAYSIFKQGQDQGVTFGGVLGGALAGGQIGGPVGAVIGGALSLIGGLFHKKAAPQPGEQNPAFFNAPSTMDYWAYRYRATGTLPSMGDMHAAGGSVVNVYIDGVKTAVRTEVAAQTGASAIAPVSAYLDLHRP